MPQLQLLSTAGLSPRQRIEYWNDCATATLATHLSVDAADANQFWGRIAHIALRDLRIAEVSSDAASVRFARHHAARIAAPLFHLLIQLSGRTVLTQNAKEAPLSPNDFTLIDCARPYTLHFCEPVTNLVITVDRETLRTYLGCPDALAAVKMSGTSGPGAFASRFLRELWSRPDELLESSDTPYLGRAMLDVAAVAYSGAMKTGTIQPSLTTRRIAIVNYIEQHLREPDLAPESIAAAFRMSSRYLHRLFDTDSESLAKYIRRRRIEESARLLASPLQRRRSISEIAYDFGFSSLAHFSKIFREHHGMSPTDYRQNALASGEPAHERALPAPLSGG